MSTPGSQGTGERLNGAETYVDKEGTSWAFLPGGPQMPA